MAEEKKEVIQIDGSLMEGGGQILRNSVTLSCLLNCPVHVYNIRAGRSNPGLRPQHMTGLQLVRDVCAGRLDGDTVGSTSINLHPSRIISGNFVADTKTAGSICLLIQVALPCLLYGPSTSQLTLKGGTNADMAPPIDYMIDVFKPAAEKFGVQFNLEIEKRGYYPKGGGIVHVKVKPVKQLRAVQMVEFGSLVRLTGFAFVAGVLPYKIAQTMAREATKLLKRRYGDVPIDIKAVQESHDKAVGNGTGIQVMAETSTGCRLAGSALGKKGVPAEQVAADAVDQLVQNLESGGCVDEHLQDQLIILMALAEGKSHVKAGPLTMHTKTAIHVAQLVTKAKFNVTPCEGDSKDETCFIECEGIGMINTHL
ncbi:RNA 3'-terminal phosphate cyclase-like [Actinia tenebrosa]|uniref:RNA 3'-terminal phosphate cyclase n=1 Tax=Actinia tenebrosa TaxID=6105 RepID=A0A6P8J397_ACTTE|nr:RNA 3'-terminal phosphate cyclase-like [Actinia tenebrosa]